MGEPSTPPKSRLQERPAVRLDELSTLIRQKRQTERLTLEQAARQSGVSAATLSRLERRVAAGGADQETSTPDVRTLGAITDWLGVALAGAGFAPVAATSARAVPEVASVPDAVEAHLRADRNLDPSTAALLARMFRAAYSEFAGESPAESDQSEHDGAVRAPRKEGE